MKKIFVAGAAAAFICAGCATQNGASMQAVGKVDAPVVNVKDGQRQERMVGSRIARDSRESAESIKSISRRAWQEGKDEKPGSPLGGGG